jgi:abortive infection bacteriophage resistance protein
MIKKEKLLRGIDSVMDIQKQLVPLLNKHVSASVFFSGLPGKDKEKIAQRFQEMAVIHTKHMDTLKSIKEEIIKGGDRVY